MLFRRFTALQAVYRTLQHAWSLATEGVAISLRSCSNYTGYQCDNEWNL